MKFWKGSLNFTGARGLIERTMTIAASRKSSWISSPDSSLNFRVLAAWYALSDGAIEIVDVWHGPQDRFGDPDR